MKEDLISFETAKLAKEKGFDNVVVNNCYCIGYNTVIPSDKIIESIGRKTVKGQFHLVLAPT